MSVVEVAPDLDAKLDALVREVGGSRVEHVRTALLGYFADLAELAEAHRRMDDIEAGRARTIPLEELMREYGMAD